MVQNPFHDLQLFDTGDHFDGTAALLTGFDIDLEHAFEALRPAHGSIARQPISGHGRASDSTLCFIEWPERAEGILGEIDLTVRLEYDPDGRRLGLMASADSGHRIISLLEHE